MTAENFEFDYRGVHYMCHKVSGFALLNAMTNAKKGPGYFYRDLMLACLVEPAFTQDDLEQMEAGQFIYVGSEILAQHNLNIADFQKSLSG